MRDQIFNRQAYKLHRNRIYNTLSSSSFLLEFCARDIINRLDLVNAIPVDILDLGARNGILTYELRHKYNNSNITAVEIAENLLAQINDATITQIVADDSNIANLNKHYDLITSLLNMHWLNDFLHFLTEVHCFLNNRGIFIGNFLGERTLSTFRKRLIEIEELLLLPHTPHVSPFIKIEDAVKLFQLAGFSTVVDIETVKVEYSNYTQLISDLHNMGETSKLSKINYGIPRQLLQYLVNIQEPIIINFDIITFIACKDNQSLQVKDY